MRLKNVIHASTYIREYPMLTLYIADAERDAGMKNLSRKEALEILNGMKVKIKIPKAAVMQNKRNAALDMAIEALKYSEIPNSSTDCISRQAALDAMETWDKFGCDPDGKLVRYDDDKHYIPYVHYEDMVHAIKHLPSAQLNLSEAYSKAVFTWLMGYQIRAAELKGRYTPYEVLSWVVNDWRKEHERSD